MNLKLENILGSYDTVLHLKLLRPWKDTGFFSSSQGKLVLKEEIFS